MKLKILLFTSIAIVFAAMLFGGLNMAPETAVAAPLSAPTPIAADRSTSPSSVATIADDAIIADGIIGCVNTTSHEKADVQYAIDQTVVNTVTLTLRFTNDTPGAGANYTTGAALVSANTADASDLNQYNLFGAWTCIYADVANANPLDVTVKALLK